MGRAGRTHPKAPEHNCAPGPLQIEGWWHFLNVHDPHDPPFPQTANPGPASNHVTVF